MGLCVADATPSWLPARPASDPSDALAPLLALPLDEAVDALLSLVVDRAGIDECDVDEVTTLEALRRKLSAPHQRSDELAAENDRLRSRLRRRGDDGSNLRVSWAGDAPGDASSASSSSSSSTVTERQHAAALATIQDLREENDALHRSLEEAMALASGMNGKLAAFVDTHEDAVREYELQLADVGLELAEADELREENERLLQERMEGVLKEREEAYEACAAFQEEINVLRKEADETKVQHAKERVRAAKRDKGTSKAREQNQRLADLTEVCEALTLELEQKNAAMESVQAALGALKDEQKGMKAIAAALGKENARLLREGASRDDTQGLKRVNAELAARLGEETERAAALQDANEGLANRICKLVSHIERQRLGSGGVTTATSCETSSSSSGSDDGSPSPASRRHSVQGPPVEHVSTMAVTSFFL